MKYVKLLDNTVCSIHDIRRENPNVSLSEDVDCSSLGYSFLVETPQPDQLPWHIVTEGEPIDGAQTWKQEPQSEAEITRICVREIQKYMDEFASTRGYDSMMSATTYATSTSPKFYTEGQYCVSARDAVWTAAYTLLNDVKAGTTAMPALDQLLALLPDLVWPN